jgi:hypothetical protein
MGWTEMGLNKKGRDTGYLKNQKTNHVTNKNAANLLKIIFLRYPLIITKTGAYSK